MRIERDRIILYVYMIFYCIILAGPIFYLFLCAFKSWTDLYKPEKLIPFIDFIPTFENFFSPNFKFINRWLFNTTLISIISSIITVAIGIFAGFSLSRAKGRIFNIARDLLILAYLFPVTFLVIGIVIMLDAIGLMNTYLGVILTYVTFNVPYVTYLIKVYTDAVPIELDESSLIDGCSRLQYVIRVILPLSKPIIATAFLWTFMWSWNEYLFALVILSSNEMLTIPVGLATLQAGEIASWGEVFAFSIYYSLLPLVIFTLSYRYFVAGLTAGAVKG